MNEVEISRQKIAVARFQIWLAERNFYSEAYEYWCSRNEVNPDETDSVIHYIATLKDKIKQLGGNIDSEEAVIDTFDKAKQTLTQSS